jgi:hypothetical protein
MLWYLKNIFSVNFLRDDFCSIVCWQILPSKAMVRSAEKIEKTTPSAPHLLLRKSVGAQYQQLGASSTGVII